MRHLHLIKAFLLMTLFFSFCSCESGDNLARKNLENLILSIEKKDSEKVNLLFSKNIVNSIPDFDNDVCELLDFYTGLFDKIISCSLTIFKEKSGISEVVFYHIKHSEILTSEGIYYFSVYWCIKDDFDTDNIGIWNLFVQKGFFDEEPIPIDGNERTNGTTYRGITIK